MGCSDQVTITSRKGSGWCKSGGGGGGGGGGEGRRLKEMLVSCNLILSVVTVASE